MEWTAEQKAAIEQQGPILVSAAAGSGKTAVLVKRVLRNLTEREPQITADRLLIVTFTNAAAAEMRNRIEKGLAEICDSENGNQRLWQQQHLLASAKICTIDSFCMDLVRENFDVLEIRPDFSVGDSKRFDKLSRLAVQSLMEDYMSECPETLYKLLEQVGSEFNFTALEEMILSIANRAENYPFPEIALQQGLQVYRCPFDKNHPWCRSALSAIKTIAKRQQIVLLAGTETAIAFADERYEKLFTDFSAQLELVTAAADRSDYEAACAAAQALKSGLPRRKPPIGKDAAGGEQLNYYYDTYKKQIDELLTVSADNAAEIEAQRQYLAPTMELLLQMVTEYRRHFFALQVEENCFTFSSIEHMALSLLCKPTEDGGYILTDRAAECANRFDEVMVDEYQDVNDLQDLMFEILSDGGRHLFAVGDMKQSIYGFRGSNPNNFSTKKNSVVNYTDAAAGDSKGIMLSKNFRSRKEICDFANFFFRNMMQRKTGELVYEKSDALICGAEFPQLSAPKIQLLMLDHVKSTESDLSSSIEGEAHCIADYIRRVMAEPVAVRGENGLLRPAKYSDFTCLMRAVSGKVDTLAEALQKCGIPVSYGHDEYLETVEITTFLALLSILDNPDNSVDLLTVLLSPMFGFTADTMAYLRADCRGGSLWQAVMRGSNLPQVADFLTATDAYRRLAAVLPLPQFIDRLLDETDYANMVSVLPDGALRRENLLLLIQYATEYAAYSAGDIGGFLRYLKNLSENSLKSAKVGGEGDSVRVMSMHKAKGLQFPICILVDLERNMHQKDSETTNGFSPEYGICLKYFDDASGTKTDAYAKKLKRFSVRDTVAQEELRLLYVAMTRAEERLVMVTADKDIASKLQALSMRLESDCFAPGYYSFGQASSMSDWILTAALLHPDADVLRGMISTDILPQADAGELAITIYDAENLPDTAAAAAGIALPAEKFDGAWRLEYEYPYADLQRVAAKISVSALANRAEFERFSFTEKPNFMQQQKIGATGRGTATHKVMQFIRLDKNISVEAEIERLTEWQFLTEIEAAAVDCAAVQSFFDSTLFQRISAATAVHRELQFLTEITAADIESDLPPQLGSEPVLVQGAVDLCFVADNRVYVVDFKTDRVENTADLADTYRKQVSIYAAAVAKIFGLPVGGCSLYSFALKKEIIL